MRLQGEIWQRGNAHALKKKMTKLKAILRSIEDPENNQALTVMAILLTSSIYLTRSPPERFLAIKSMALKTMASVESAPCPSSELPNGKRR